MLVKVRTDFTIVSPKSIAEPTPSSVTSSWPNWSAPLSANRFVVRFQRDTHFRASTHIRPLFSFTRLRGSGKSLSMAVIEESCHAFAPRRVVVVGQSHRGIDNPPENCVDLTNQTSLLQLIWLIRAAHFIVSVDSGPMHIAAALTDRLLSIHTWTEPRLIGPYKPERVDLEKRATLPRQQTSDRQNASSPSLLQTQRYPGPDRTDPTARPAGFIVRLATRAFNSPAS
jgi:hypothetical protein